jgi:erythromycin esterase
LVRRLAPGETLNDGPGFYSGALFTELKPPETGSLDALMAATYGQPFAADLRELSPADAAAVQKASKLRSGSYYADLSPLDAFDIVVHLPHVTRAGSDADAVAHSPAAISSHWRT